MVGKTIYIGRWAMAKSILDEKATTIILQAFKRGNSVELKKEQGKLVVVEIQRKMKIKASITG